MESPGKGHRTDHLCTPTKNKEESLGWLELLTGFTFHPSKLRRGKWGQKIISSMLTLPNKEGKRDEIQ